MPKDSDFPAPTTMAARLGSDLLLSLGVATAAALLVMVPVLMSDAAPDRAKAPTPILLRDGKISDRLAEAGQAGEGAFAAGGLLTPAALAMPMSLAWPEQEDWTLPRVTLQAEARAASGAAPLPPRRLAVLSRQKGQPTAQPLVILPPAALTALEPAQASGNEAAGSALHQVVVTPAMKVVDAMSDAAGSVQAAGSWTLTQAKDLLPRW